MARGKTTGFAAYRKDADFLPFSSIGASEDYVENWIDRTYVSGIERRKFEVVDICVTVIPMKRKRTR